MATNLLEAYSKRIKIAESIYSKSHNGEKMDNHRKLVLARCLSNVNAYLNEAFENSVGTQRADLGSWKKFCINLTNVALPTLIANDLVLVSPMSSMSGFITYINYTAGTTKGNVNQGDIFNNPFKLGDVDGDDPTTGVGNGHTANYTSANVVESVTAGTGAQALAWTPVVKGAIEYNNVAYDIKLVKSGASDIYGFYNPADKKFYEDAAYATQITVASDTKVAYVYDNVVIPQNDLPTLNAKMDAIPLMAKARRIAVYYSQIAAFQAKTDYGFDLGDQLAEKAAGQLAYEIDTEVVNLLDSTAGTAAGELTWSKTLPIGVSKAQHYEGFSEIVGIARQLIYDKTRRFAPNYMIIASNILPILSFIGGWNAAATGTVNGPYFAGTLDGLKVYVTPSIAPGRFLVGVNGDDFMSSVAVYAPYMPIVPTQLLQYADGGTSQGFSTLYDLKVLNKDLIVAGEVTA